MPTNVRLTPPEVAYLAEASGARVLLRDHGFAAHAGAVRAAKWLESQPAGLYDMQDVLGLK